ncbi:uncharacterized protein LOC131684630 isoform X2 [Topomyia yanbarensis]|uniref:uncharacterized protein LOC131684630 isoform X2 n=1 Tax=Topomyia yanbarensis TaxID=2498891 RepID=UPI00273A9734|nr:uncharacterized protein LOC131684630 isoform X2 [Topomyia yanbarensis]
MFRYNDYSQTPDMANARYDSAYKVQDAPVLIDGTDACVVVEFCRLRNCSLELFDDEIETWGDVFENRTGTGIMGAVASRNAHFAAAAIYYWLGPCHWTSYTTQITRAAVTVLVPRPLQLAPWKTPFLSFTGVLWIAVGVAFTVGVFAVWLVENGRARILNLPKAQAKSFSDSVLTLIGFYMEQSSSTRTDLVCCIFLFTSLIIAGFMIGNMYGAGLAGVMTIPQYERPIDTTVDLANSGLLFAGTVINWIYCILESTEPHLITLGDNYRVLDTEHLMKHSKTRDMGFVGEFTEFGHFTPVDFLDAESASMLRILKDDLAWQSTTILMTKTCPFRQSFSDLVMNVRQSGIQHLIEYRVSIKFMDRKVQKSLESSRQKNSEQEAVVLTILHLLGAFIILALGFLLASIVFALEYISGRTARKPLFKEGNSFRKMFKSRTRN